MLSLECESYSLAIESREAYYSSLGAVSMSRASAKDESLATASSAARSEGVRGSALGSITREGASDSGATASTGVAPETMTWVERPTSIGQAQQGGGGTTTVGAAKFNALLLLTAVLALLSVFYM